MEVSRYEDWNPANILERGEKMLRFMADRWGFRFRNEYDMLRLLGLEFMTDEPVETLEEDESEEDDTPVRPKRVSRIITEEMIQKSYELAKEVYNANLEMQDAVAALEEIGMNPASAWMHLDCFMHMMEGKCYKRAISRVAMLYYVDKIGEDFGAEYKSKALESVKQNYLYKKEKGYDTVWIQEWLESQGVSVS